MPRNAWLWLVVPSIALIGCAAGDTRFTPENPAGFWAGLWHGMIALITLILGIFSDGVAFYEVDNGGWWYDAGFWLGFVIMAGGAHRGATQPSRRARDKEWDEIGKRVEAKLKRLIRSWAEAEPDEDWKVVEAKAEAKLKRELRKWADEP